MIFLARLDLVESLREPGMDVLVVSAGCTSQID
jgi:hypothetical protein